MLRYSLSLEGQVSLEKATQHMRADQPNVNQGPQATTSSLFEYRTCLDIIIGKFTF